MREDFRKILTGNLFLFLLVAIVGILWLLSYEEPPVFSIYETRMIILFLILSNYLSWRSINYFYISDGRRLRICKNVVYFLLFLIPLLLIFDLGRILIYLFLLLVFVTFLLTRYLKILFFLPILFLSYEGMALYLVILTLFFLEDLFLLREKSDILIPISLIVFVLLEILGLRSLSFSLTLISTVLYTSKIFLKQRTFMVKLLLPASLSLIFLSFPASRAGEIYQAMFHVMITCCYAIFFVIFCTILGRRGWIRFRRGYSSYLKFVYIGILILFFHQISYIFPSVYFLSFLLIGIYGIFFIYFSYRILQPEKGV